MSILKFKGFRFLGMFAVLLLAVVAKAYASDQDIGEIASGVTNSFTGLGKLIVAAAYLAGFGLTLASIFKFKAHKDNPQQVPMGTPVALLVIGVVLVFLPSLFAPAGQSVFGESKTAGGFGGGGAESVPGGSE